MHVHVLMTDEEERSKQGQTKNKAKQHSTPNAVTFPKKNKLPRVGLEPTTLYTPDMYVTRMWVVESSREGDPVLVHMQIHASLHHCSLRMLLQDMCVCRAIINT